jgi:hypothetical protein
MMDIKKTILAIAVIILFFGLTITPAIGAEPLVVKTKKMTILMHGVAGEDYLVEMEVKEEDFQKINNEYSNFMEIINITRNKNSEQGVEISDNEWNLFKDSIDKIIDLIADIVGDDFPIEDTKIFVNSLIERLINPINLFSQPLISVGIGITFIPFYDYETFFGKLIRPVIIQHLFGFSATIKFSPFIVGFPSVRIALHRIRTFFFNGLMINFADMGVNKVIGPQLLLGFGCFTGFA